MKSKIIQPIYFNIKKNKFKKIKKVLNYPLFVILQTQKPELWS